MTFICRNLNLFFPVFYSLSDESKPSCDSSFDLSKVICPVRMASCGPSVGSGEQSGAGLFRSSWKRYLLSLPPVQQPCGIMNALHILLVCGLLLPLLLLQFRRFLSSQFLPQFLFTSQFFSHMLVQLLLSPAFFAPPNFDFRSCFSSTSFRVLSVSKPPFRFFLPKGS